VGASAHCTRKKWAISKICGRLAKVMYFDNVNLLFFCRKFENRGVRGSPPRKIYECSTAVVALLPEIVGDLRPLTLEKVGDF